MKSQVYSESMLTIKRFLLLAFFMFISILTYGQVLTGINWVNWAEEPDYANTPYSERETYTVYRAPADWAGINDVQSFQSTWEILGEEQNVAKHVRGEVNPLDLENKKFGVQWKAIHDGDIMYVLLRYYDVDALSDPGSLAFEVMAQPKDFIRHEPTFQAGVDMNDIAQRNMAYGRYVELGGGKTLYKDGNVDEYTAIDGLLGNWMNNEYALLAFSDLNEMMFWHEQNGEIMAVLPMDFAGVLSYPDDPENIEGERTALQVGETIAFDVRTQDRINGELIYYQWSGNHNNAYASNYYSGHVTIADQNLINPEPYTLTLLTNDEAMGSIIQGDGVHDEWSSVVIKAEANPEYEFVSWTDEQDNEVGSLSTLDYTMPSRDVTLTANFREEPDYYSLDIFSQPTEAGNVLGSGMYEAEETVSVNASPQSGYSFVQWTDYHGNHISHMLEFEYTMPEKPDTLVAHFEEAEITDPPFTGISWVDWAEEPDYANTPYSGRETYTVYRAPTDWSVINDAQSFQTTWEILGEEQNVVKHVSGAENPLDLENKKFGVQWKAIHDGDIMYVLLRYYDVDALSDPGSLAFEVMAQPKDIIRHESTYLAGVDMDDIAQRNMSYGRYVELGGGMAIYEDGAVSQYSATSGLSGNWWNNEYGFQSFIDLSGMMFWHEQDGEIMAVLPMDFAGVLSYPDDPENIEGERTALQVGETIAFDIRTQAKMNDENLNYQWSGNHNNAYASNYYSGHVTIADQDLADPEPYTLTLLKNDEAMGSIIQGSGVHNEWSSVVIKAEANPEYEFVSWTDEQGNEVGSLSTLEYTMPSRDVTLTANFREEPDYYSLDIFSQPTEAGNVLGSGMYEAEETVSVNASPHSGYSFVQWTDYHGNHISHMLEFEHTMPDKPDTLVAHFEEVEITDPPFTGISWVNWAEEPDYANTPYSGRETYTVYRAPADWSVIDDAQSFQSTWETLGEEQNVVKHVRGADNPLDLENKKFGVQWKAIHDGDIMYVLLRYYDVDALSDPGSLAFEVMAQPKDIIRHESTYQEGVDMDDIAQRNMAYGRYVELGGGMAIYEDGAVSQYSATSGLSGNWWNNEYASQSFIDLSGMMFWHEQNGEIMAVLPMDFAGVLSYPNDPENIEGERTALQVGQTIAFDVRTRAKMNDEFISYQWSGNHNNAYASNYYSGHVTIADQNLADPEPYTLTLLANDEAMGSIIQGSGVHNEWSSVVIKAEANPEYVFLNWTDEQGNVIGSLSTLEYKMPSRDDTLTANFGAESDYYSLDVFSQPTEAGNVLGSGMYEAQETVTVNASPQSGYSFVQWTDFQGNHISHMPDFEHAMSAKPDTLVAHFEEVENTDPPFTGINWVNWAEEPDYANTPYSDRETYTVYRAPSDWSVIDDAQSFQSTWETLGEEQNVVKHVSGAENPLDLENKKFGVQWKAIHDGDIMYVLLRYYDVDALSDPGSLAFEVMAQPKDIIRHESTYLAGVDMDDIAQRNMAYGRYVELGGGKALYKNGDVDEYTAISGLSGSWMNNYDGLFSFLNLSNMMFWHEQDGEIMAVLPMDFAGVLSYPDDPENMEGERTALQVGETIAFDVRSQAKMNDEFISYQWSGNKNNAYASNYYSGHVTILNLDLVRAREIYEAGIQIKTNSDGEGYVVGGGFYSSGDTVQLSVRPSHERSRFVGWNENYTLLEDTKDTIVFEARESREIVAVFKSLPTGVDITLTDDDHPDIIIFPNPAKTEVTVQSGEWIDFVSVVDINGKIILNEPVNGQETSFGVQSLQPGIYLINVKTQSGVHVRKLQVEE